MLTADNRIDIDREQILSSIGYNEEDEPSHRVNSLVSDYIENYHDLISSSYSYFFYNIERINGNRVSLGNDVVLKSSVVAALLKRCDIAAVFVLTIGNYLEDMVAHLSEDGLMVQATVLDAIGSGTAEQLAHHVESEIRRIALAVNLVTSRRFSPGYCDWEVDQQEMIFRALNGDTAGVYLTESMLMMPRKSVSGIIGIGLPDKGIEEYNPCITCNEKECPGRRK